MSKGGSQTVSTMPDANTQNYVNQLRQYALGSAGLGNAPSGGYPNPGQQWIQQMVPGAIPGATPGMPFPGATGPNPVGANPLYGAGRQLGFTGLNALGGNPQALQQLMGGYGSLMDPYWNQLRQQTLSTIGDQATLQGGYGGSRQGVAEGAALGQIGIGQAGQRYGEYQNALGRAGQLANLGFGIDPQIMGLLQGGIGPYGQTQTQQTHPDWFSQLLGTAALVGSVA